MKCKDLITIADLLPSDIEEIFNVTRELKEWHNKGYDEKCLSGKILGMIFKRSCKRWRQGVVALCKWNSYSYFCSGNNPGTSQICHCACYKCAVRFFSSMSGVD